MIGSGHVDRRWMIGGALGAAVLLAVGWFFLIAPQNSQASTLRDQTAAAEQGVTILQQRLVELRKQQVDLPRYEEELARDRQALPSTSGMSDFLRELQGAGSRTGVSVSGITVAAPSQLTTATNPTHVLPITLIATGPDANMRLFLDLLQHGPARAVLINTVNAVPSDPAGTLGGSVTVTLDMHAFVAAPAGTEDAAPAPPK